MRILSIVGLVFALIGFWNPWFLGTDKVMSGEFWYVFGASPIYAIAVAAVLILVLTGISFRFFVGFELPVIGVLSVFIVLTQWLLVLMGCMEIGISSTFMWSSVRVLPSFYIMLLGQAMMLWGSIAAYADQRLAER